MPFDKTNLLNRILNLIEKDFAWRNELQVDPRYQWLLTYGVYLNNSGYAVLWYQQKKWLLHRLIISLEIGRNLAASEFVDHINYEKLDNRLISLRIVSKQGNNQNLNPKLYPFRGAQKLTNGRYRARVLFNHKDFHCGCFDTSEEAANAASHKREELGFLKNSN